jgi:hypothetical protein
MSGRDGDCACVATDTRVRANAEINKRVADAATFFQPDAVSMSSLPPRRHPSRIPAHHETPVCAQIM